MYVSSSVYGTSVRCKLDNRNGFVEVYFNRKQNFDFDFSKYKSGSWS